VREYLSNALPDHWIGKGGVINWPARSPDLNPLDFFVWGFLKREVNKMQPNTLEELKETIMEASNKITPTILKNVRGEFYNRLGYCLVKQGGHFENEL